MIDPVHRHLSKLRKPALGLGLTLGLSGRASGGGAAPVTTNITLPADVWAFGSSSTSGAQTATNGLASGPEDFLTNTVRAIEGLSAGSLAYTTVSGSQITRPIDYNLTGANSARKVKNRGISGQTSGSGGAIVGTMSTASSGFATGDFMLMHQGDNGISSTGPNSPETLAGGYAALRALAGAHPYVQIISTQGGRGSAGALSGEGPGGPRATLNDVSYRIQCDLNPGKVASFHHPLIERSTPADANDTLDIDQGYAPRSHMMNDGSHQIAGGYNLQSDSWVTPVIDAWAGGTPFPLRQVIEAVAPSTPAAGDVIGSIVAYGSGGTFSLDATNVQTDYAVGSSGQITRVGATPAARDITWAAVKMSKSGRNDKVQPRIGIAERAASGVSRLVEFDGKSVIGMTDSKLANTAKLTLLFRVRAVDQGTAWNVFGSTNQCNVRLLTNGTLDVVWRDPSATVIVNKNTAANFTTGSADRWVALCVDLSDPAAEVTKLITWAVPATATSDTTVVAALTADTTTAHFARLDQPLAIGYPSVNANPGVNFAKMRLGDVMLYRDYIDFSVQATREIVSDAAGLPQAAWAAGLGVVLGITPDVRLQGLAADFRMCRTTGIASPASPGASGQYFGFTNQRRADGEWGYLTTI